MSLITRKSKGEKCSRCCRKIAKAVFWLEYDQRKMNYSDEKVPKKYSQGFFPFHPSCAGRYASSGDISKVHFIKKASNL